jgi:hypothetical protein
VPAFTFLDLRRRPSVPFTSVVRREKHELVLQLARRDAYLFLNAGHDFRLRDLQPTAYGLRGHSIEDTRSTKPAAPIQARLVAASRPCGRFSETASFWRSARFYLDTFREFLSEPSSSSFYFGFFVFFATAGLRGRSITGQRPTKTAAAIKPLWLRPPGRAVPPLNYDCANS